MLAIFLLEESCFMSLWHSVIYVIDVHLILYVLVFFVSTILPQNLGKFETFYFLKVYSQCTWKGV